ncbi:Ferritin light chain 1 [Camelus dromedarius]|uniref:Ferritin light chain n=1 Tax=Camelus dromedarius TaxID=9838 RepID=A0A5N4EF99_CAMDR|nr:Ferritin light chain 1 [Camelus dromedarius]
MALPSHFLYATQAPMVSGQNRPRDPLAPASHHPPAFFPVATFRTSHSATLGLRDQPTPSFELSSLLRINCEPPDWSELPHQVEAAFTCPVTLHLWAPSTYLSLGSYFPQDQVALEGVGHFPRISQGEARGPRASLEDAKPVGDRALLQNKQKPPQDEWGETQDAVEATGALSGPPALGSACRPLLRDVLEMHLLLAQVRLIQKTGGGPPDPPVQVGWSPGAGLVSLPKAQPQARLRGSGSQQPWGGPLVSGFLPEASLCRHQAAF